MSMLFISIFSFSAYCLAHSRDSIILLKDEKLTVLLNLLINTPKLSALYNGKAKSPEDCSKNQIKSGSRLRWHILIAAKAFPFQIII